MIIFIQCIVIFLSVSRSYFLSLIYPLSTISPLGHTSHSPTTYIIDCFDNTIKILFDIKYKFLSTNCEVFKINQYEKNIDDVKIYEIKKITVKRNTFQNSKHLIKQFDYKSKYNV